MPGLRERQKPDPTGPKSGPKQAINYGATYRQTNSSISNADKKKFTCTTSTIAPFHIYVHFPNTLLYFYDNRLEPIQPKIHVNSR